MLFLPIGIVEFLVTGKLFSYPFPLNFLPLWQILTGPLSKTTQTQTWPSQGFESEHCCWATTWRLPACLLCLL